LLSSCCCHPPAPFGDGRGGGGGGGGGVRSQKIQPKQSSRHPNLSPPPPISHTRKEL
jgi:hypothetical protein